MRRISVVSIEATAGARKRGEGPKNMTTMVAAAPKGVDGRIEANF